MIHCVVTLEKKNASEENGIQSADPNSRQVLSDIYEKSEEAAESLSQRKETMLSRHPETTNELTKRANMPCAESKQGAQDPKVGFLKCIISLLNTAHDVFWFISTRPKNYFTYATR